MAASTSRRSSERGEGNWGNLFMLGFTLILAIMVFSAGPVFWENFQFQDRLTEISRSFPPGPKGDESGMAAVKKAIADSGLSEFLAEDACSVTSQGGIGGTRTVTCTYTRPYKLFPGVNKQYTFSPSATSPTF